MEPLSSCLYCKETIKSLRQFIEEFRSIKIKCIIIDSFDWPTYSVIDFYLKYAENIINIMNDTKKSKLYSYKRIYAFPAIKKVDDVIFENYFAPKEENEFGFCLFQSNLGYFHMIRAKVYTDKHILGHLSYEPEDILENWIVIDKWKII